MEYWNKVIISAAFSFIIIVVALKFVSIPGQTRESYPLHNTVNTPLDSAYKCIDCNVVLISIDTLRADHLDVYGYNKSTAPEVGRLARSGTVFKNVISTSPWTLPSHASIFTGLYPAHHRARHYNSVLDASIPTVTTMLKTKDYFTVGFADGGYVDPSFGFNNGFDVYESTRLDHYSSPEVHKNNNTVHKALQWLENNSDRKFFLFIHSYQVHDYANRDDSSLIDAGLDKIYKNEFENQTGVRDFINTYAVNNLTNNSLEKLRYLEQRYDSSIHDLDEQLGELFKIISSVGISNRTIIVITSDHGEEFGEHGHTGHMSRLYTEYLNVPLIIIFPGINTEGKSLFVDEPVSLIDIYPTLMSALGVMSNMTDGINLIPLITLQNVPLNDRHYSDRVLFSDVDFNFGWRYTDRVATGYKVFDQGSRLIHMVRENVPENTRLGGLYALEFSEGRTFRRTINDTTLDLQGYNSSISVKFGVLYSGGEDYNISFRINNHSLDYSSSNNDAGITYSIDVPQAYLQDDNPVLHLIVTTFNPNKTISSLDTRDLGVALDWVKITPITNLSYASQLPELFIDLNNSLYVDRYEYYSEEDTQEKVNRIHTAEYKEDIMKKRGILTSYTQDILHEKLKNNELDDDVLAQLRSLGYVR